MKKFDALSKQAEASAELLKVLGHPERLMVLCHLIEGEKSVGELLDHSRLSQSAFSQQLAVLKMHGVVQTRKEGQHVFYSLQHPAVADLLSALAKNFCRTHPRVHGDEKHMDEDQQSV